MGAAEVGAWVGVALEGAAVGLADGNSVGVALEGCAVDGTAVGSSVANSAVGVGITDAISVVGTAEGTSEGTIVWDAIPPMPSHVYSTNVDAAANTYFSLASSLLNRPLGTFSSE